MAPWFEGSANYRVLPIPNLDLRFQRDKFFLSARDGVGATLFDTDCPCSKIYPAMKSVCR